MPAPAPSAELGRRDLLVSQIASVQKLVRIGRRPAGLHKRRLTSVALASYNQRQSEGRPSAASARTVVAVKTPYLEDGQFDLGAYEEHLTRMVDSGVEGVVVGGTTGEGHLMSWDEHLMLIAWTVRNFGDRIKIIGNTGSNSTREAVHATEQGFAVGMHASLQINPYYGKTSKSGLYAHFEATLDEGPAIIYNVPGRTGQDIPDDVILDMAKHPNLLGVKECTGNNRILSYAEKGIKCWSGNDDECHQARHKYRSYGVISVAANLVPGAWAKLMGPEPDYELMDKLMPFTQWLFHEPNPIPLNTAMAMCGLCNPVFRAPYTFCSKEKRIEGAKIMSDIMEYMPGVHEIKVMEDSDFKIVTKF